MAELMWWSGDGTGFRVNVDRSSQSQTNVNHPG